MSGRVDVMLRQLRQWQTAQVGSEGLEVTEIHVDGRLRLVASTPQILQLDHHDFDSVLVVHSQGFPVLRISQLSEGMGGVYALMRDTEAARMLTYLKSRRQKGERLWTNHGADCELARRYEMRPAITAEVFTGPAYYDAMARRSTPAEQGQRMHDLLIEQSDARKGRGWQRPGGRWR